MIKMPVVSIRVVKLTSLLTYIGAVLVRMLLPQRCICFPFHYLISLRRTDLVIRNARRKSRLNIDSRKFCENGPFIMGIPILCSLSESHVLHNVSANGCNLPKCNTHTHTQCPTKYWHSKSNST
jgi:hypothetical protein